MTPEEYYYPDIDNSGVEWYEREGIYEDCED